MLTRHLRALPPLASCLPPGGAAKLKKKKASPPKKKKSRNLVKLEQLKAEANKPASAVPGSGASATSGGSDVGDAGISPISRLIQIQQAKREKEPVYTLVSEKGMPRKREFIMQVGTT